MSSDEFFHFELGIMCSESSIDIRTCVVAIYTRIVWKYRMRKSKDRQHNTNNSSYCCVLLNAFQFLKTYLPCNDISQSDHFLIRYHSSVFVLNLLSIRLIDIWVHKTSLNPPLFIEVPVTNQECERWCICVRDTIYYMALSTILIFDFRIVPTVCYVLEWFRQCGMS